jgi:hypothetical protein
MTNRISSAAIALLTAASFAACSDAQSPSAPAAAPGAANSLSAKPSAAAAPGIYQLTFNTYRNGVYTEVTSLPVYTPGVMTQEMILKAYVTDSAGAPATKGTVTFEYCSYNGGPSNDITRPDEAPKEACDAGTASWARLEAMTVTSGRCPQLGTGYACSNFGVVRIPRDVGFRFRYSPQGSPIAAGMSEMKNFTWTEQ